MTLNEFNFWLYGFSESFIDGSPSKNQWEKIRENLKKIEPNSNPIVIKEYIPTPTWTPSTWPVSPWSLPVAICTSGTTQLGAS